MMQITPLELPDVVEIVPRRIADSRGYFCETYNAEALGAYGIDLVFVQDNHSHSEQAGVLRGLHYQLPPRAQDKLLRVVRGRIFDVAVDIRRDSPTFGRWVGLELSAEVGNQILIPKGFAHGFVTMEPNSEVLYKVTDTYSPQHDRSIRFDDPAIGIRWPVAPSQLHISDKDRMAPVLGDADIFDRWGVK